MDLSEWDAQDAKEINTKELDELVVNMQNAWQAYEEKKNEASRLREAYEEIESKVLFFLKEAKKSKYFVDNVGTVYIINKFSVTTPKTIEDKEKLFNYFKEKGGREFFLSMVSVNSNTLNSYYQKELEAAKARGEANFSVPGISEPKTNESLGFRKAKNE